MKIICIFQRNRKLVHFLNDPNKTHNRHFCFWEDLFDTPPPYTAKNLRKNGHFLNELFSGNFYRIFTKLSMFFTLHICEYVLWVFWGAFESFFESWERFYVVKLKKSDKKTAKLVEKQQNTIFFLVFPYKVPEWLKFDYNL